MTPAPMPLPTPRSHAGGNPSGAPAGSLSAPALEDLARQVFGTQKAAEFWMKRPNPELAGETPNDLITAGRAQVVKDFLDGILTGNYG